jgi:hypothetical protein
MVSPLPIFMTLLADWRTASSFFFRSSIRPIDVSDVYLRSAGATKEIIAAAVKAVAIAMPHPGGRPRKHASAAERVRDNRKRKPIP